MTKPADDIRRMIDEMKGIAPDVAKEAAAQLLEQAIVEAEAKEDIVAAANPDGVREITRQLALIKAQRAALEKTEKDFTAVLKTLIGGHNGIRAGSQVLARTTPVHVERVNTKLVAELYPISEYPQLYNVSDEVRLVLDNDFKKQVVADAGQPEIEETA